MGEKGQREKKKVNLTCGVKDISHRRAGEKHVDEKEGEGKGEQRPLSQKFLFEGKFLVLLQ